MSHPRPLPDPGEAAGMALLTVLVTAHVAVMGAAALAIDGLARLRRLLR